MSHVVRLRNPNHPAEPPGQAVWDTDTFARAVQIGLAIYLTPVVLLVAVIGTASWAAQVAVRLVHRSEASLDGERRRLAFDSAEEEVGPTGERRRLPVAH